MELAKNRNVLTFFSSVANRKVSQVNNTTSKDLGIGSIEFVCLIDDFFIRVVPIDEISINGEHCREEI